MRALTLTRVGRGRIIERLERQLAAFGVGVGGWGEESRLSCRYLSNWGHFWRKGQQFLGGLTLDNLEVRTRKLDKRLRFVSRPWHQTEWLDSDPMVS